MLSGGEAEPETASRPGGSATYGNRRIPATRTSHSTVRNAAETAHRTPHDSTEPLKRQDFRIALMGRGFPLDDGWSSRLALASR